MEYILTMSFVCASGDRTSITVDGVTSTLSNVEVRALMDTIIEKNIFIRKNGSLVEKYSANLTQRQTTKLQVK
ncbi:DUF2922 domain-containing protein [Clostridium paraputrificum]|uniref:DUF2922 domain-containing protein n=1 Tax=Clostridium paraputrificum TaxID=29363 RepID=UPI003D33BE1D